MILEKMAYRLGRAKKVRVDSLGGELEVLIDNERHPFRDVRPVIGVGRDAGPGEIAYGIKTAQEGYRKILKAYD